MITITLAPRLQRMQMSTRVAIFCAFENISKPIKAQSSSWLTLRLIYEITSTMQRPAPPTTPPPPPTVLLPRTDLAARSHSTSHVHVHIHIHVHVRFVAHGGGYAVVVVVIVIANVPCMQRQLLPAAVRTCRDMSLIHFAKNFCQLTKLSSIVNLSHSQCSTVQVYNN